MQLEFKEFLDKHQVREWNNPKHYYDYFRAFKEGATPDKEGHWPSKYKHPMHPNRYIKEGGEWTDTITGKKADYEDKILQDFKRKDFEMETKMSDYDLINP